MSQQSYHVPNGLVNTKLAPLHPGEIRVGGVRLYPTLEHGDSTIRVHVTNEVDMFIARAEARLAYARAIFWSVAFFLVLMTFVGLLLDRH